MTNATCWPWEQVSNDVLKLGASNTVEERKMWEANMSWPG